MSAINSNVNAQEVDPTQKNDAAFSRTQWLGVSCLNDCFLLPIVCTGEIIPMATIQSLPHVKPWFKGVSNIRGGIYGVVDLSEFTALYKPNNGGSKPSAKKQTQYSLVTINPSLGVNISLLVDGVNGLKTKSELHEIPQEGAGLPHWYGKLYQNDQSQI